MNNTISIIRIAILFAIFGFGMAFLLDGDSECSSIFQIIISKALALAALWYATRLYKRWAKSDNWLRAYDKKCDEVLDIHNPGYCED